MASRATIIKRSGAMQCGSATTCLSEYIRCQKALMGLEKASAIRPAANAGADSGRDLDERIKSCKATA